MKKITNEAVKAFVNGYAFKSANTIVTIGADRELKLFGNTIARYNNGNLEINDGGYQSVTTKERLNGLLEYLGLAVHKVYQRQGVWYFDRWAVKPNGAKERYIFDDAKQSNGFISLSYMRGL